MNKKTDSGFIPLDTVVIIYKWLIENFKVDAKDLGCFYFWYRLWKRGDGWFISWIGLKGTYQAISNCKL